MQGQMNVPPGMAMALDTQARLMAAQGQFTPVKKDGGLTVAAQNLAALSQREAAKQAQTASGIEAMKQAQMQQQLQQMLAQKAAPPTPLASGLGALGADVRMAEGGVVGYSGEDGSEVDLPVNERFKRALRGIYERIETDYMRRAGATPEMIAKKLGQEPPVSPTPRPMSEAETARIQEANVAPSGGGITTPTPRPPSAPRRQPAASPAPAPAAAPAAPMLPDTRESTAVNPSEAALMYAQMQGGLKELLERQSKPRERTPEELKEAAAREEEVKRRMGEIDASKARFEQAKQERLAGQKGQGLRDLASFLSSAGGARSGLAGLGQATLRMDPIFAARAAEEQRMREQELAFMDKLGERRNLVNDLRLASLKDDAGRAREDAARLRALDLEISKLGLGLGEKRAGELAIAEREREKTAATAKEGELNRAKDIKVAQIGAAARTAGAEGRGALTPRDIARFRAQAEKDVDTQLKADPSYVSMKVRNPTAAETYRTDLIDKRLKRVLADEGFGAAAPTPAPAAGQLSPEVLSQFKVRPVGQ